MVKSLKPVTGSAPWRVVARGAQQPVRGEREDAEALAGGLEELPGAAVLEADVRPAGGVLVDQEEAVDAPGVRQGHNDQAGAGGRGRQLLPHQGPDEAGGCGAEQEGGAVRRGPVRGRRRA